jgi:hypothetical protein
MRYAILSSIALSQVGFVSAYTIFVAENLQSFVYAASRCTSFIPIQYFILLQLVIFLPMALIRNLAKLSITVLVADAFILAGLVYIFGSEFGIIAQRGIAKVELFNPKDFPLLIGYVAFPVWGLLTQNVFALQHRRLLIRRHWPGKEIWSPSLRQPFYLSDRSFRSPMPCANRTSSPRYFLVS